MLRVGTVVLKVEDARRASQFWSQALGYACQDGGYHPGATPVLLPHQLPHPHHAAPIAIALVVLADPEGNHFCVVNTSRDE